MSKLNHSHRAGCALLFAALLSGCITVGGVPPKMPVGKPTVPAEEKVSELDAKISQQEKDVQFITDVINQTTLEWIDATEQLNAGKTFTHSADLMGAGGQNPGEYNSERLVRLNKDLDAQRKELERTKRQLQSLKRERDEAQKSTAGGGGGGSH